MTLRKNFGKIKRKIQHSINDHKQLSQLLKKINTDLMDNINQLSIKSKFPTLRICGNGNSLAEMDSNNSYDYLVVNFCVKSELFFTIKPRYYVVIDEVPFNDEKFFNSMLVPISEQVTWEMFFFTREKFRNDKLEKLFQKNKNIHLVYWNCYPVQDLSENNRFYCYDHNLGIPCVENVMVAAIYLGIMLKYPTIELYGVNHDWTKYLFVDKDNFVRMYDRHFYETSQPTSIVFEYEPGVPIKMYQIMEMFAHIFKAYTDLQQLAIKHNVSVINHTKESFIDAFKRYE